MPKFRVLIQRNTAEYQEITVEAECSRDAEELVNEDIACIYNDIPTKLIDTEHKWVDAKDTYNIVAVL